jgi:hypothetical protein
VNPECWGISTTAVGSIHEDILHHPRGDSRAYRLRAGTLEPITRDHPVNLDRRSWPDSWAGGFQRDHRAVGLDLMPRSTTATSLEHGDLYLLAATA